jgi:hypothetical protein
MRKDLERRLKKLEAASSNERFDRIGGIVCIGMGSAEDREPAANKETPAAAGELDSAADEDMLAKEMGNPEPAVVQEAVAADGEDRKTAADEEWVHDWYVEADGRVSKILKRICFNPSDLGRNYRRDEMGKMSEDPGLDRRVSRAEVGTIIWAVPKPGTKPFPAKVGTRVIKYA